MGAQKFQAQLKTFGVEIEEDETIRIIQVYRSTYDKIPDLWKQAQRCLEAMVTKSGSPFSVVDAVQFDPMQNGFLLPSGLWQRYEGLEKIYDSEGKSQYQYKTRKGMVKIYGGKVVENLCQAVARCVIAEQMLLIGKKYKVVLTVHDAVACLAPEEEAEEAQQYVEQCMKTRPSWAQTLPLSCESGVGKSYGEC
jgi:DNA polymerase